ncbi:hypothetical protein H6P81_010027 [Aristolochia fimbriata]|uniref:CCHC-type domain-containing protein n=1 Tax=Aristolochia fimbriata TaxID=158543 RepID=A0AAV7EQY6_ARIFI|nr:hypothetical protein H6P81_010027 [Aristolochia fimbriata]
MGTVDFISLDAVEASDMVEKSDGPLTSNSESGEINDQANTSEEISVIENLGQPEGHGGTENSPKFQSMELDKDVVKGKSVLQENCGVVESVEIIEKTGDKKAVENGSFTTLDDGSGRSSVVETYISGRKRARSTSFEQQPSVCVIYSSLSKNSKKKLEELMQRWSQWHAVYDSVSTGSSSEPLESGEEIYFPAIHVGVEKSNTVSFWVDKQARPNESTEIVTLDNDSVPMYDRGYGLGLNSGDRSTQHDSKGIEVVEASRCFNCGSYNHSLKECPKPRDNVAVNNARKQHNLKRNPTLGPRCPTRYYQNSPGGKFDGLKPGVLGAETRQCLGIGENDPPPWLNRMREIGYPPGYIDTEVEDEPSGIIIYGDDEPKTECEDGEIVETAEPGSEEKKMIVAFPGVNAPIPENADERLWARSPSILGHYRSQSHSNSRSYGEQKWSRDYRDEAPPGVDTWPRHGDYDSVGSSDYMNSRNNPVSRDAALGRSRSDRGWRSPSALESPTGQGSSYYSSSHLSSNFPKHPVPDLDRWVPENKHNSGSDSSSQRRDRHEHRHHHWR